MKRKTLIVGNWKMHLNASQASLLVQRLHERIKTHRSVEIVIAPTMLTLQPLSHQIDRRKLRLAAQNAYYQDEGAYTGEVSFSMLRDLVHYVIVGHSDRRRFFHESLDDVSQKMAACFRNQLIPILCVGESAQEKKDEETRQVISDQVISGLSALTSEEVEQLVIAYEPVWALSSGTDFLHHATPKPDEVASIVQLIRHNISELYGKKVAERVRVLYGGSSNASNASGLMSIEGIDGLLVGGASLNYSEFSNIVDAAYRLNKREETGGQQ